MGLGGEYYWISVVGASRRGVTVTLDSSTTVEVTIHRRDELQRSTLARSPLRRTLVS